MKLRVAFLVIYALGCLAQDDPKCFDNYAVSGYCCRSKSREDRKSNATELNNRKCQLRHTWTFNWNANYCIRFIYRGCGGTKNRFPTLKMCEEYCLVGNYGYYDDYNYFYYNN
ncbi:uncharacterized protein LOC115631933 isoform X2 [Scaptodrosophila lebanonensis]|uniref:Uncharacterized protein LOC115631933 isoform X2 n=1 Tax=Drosophila lebanonensis TaxID=7225 RepID=A0A6J2U9J3_DROLE|nr:uncharacterized protein LOC115631933 isoform X2 [Scaptodrosophila lebanonensis]